MVNLETLLFYIALGVFVFSGSVVIMVLLFGISMSKAFNEKKGLMGLAFLSLVVSSSVYSVRQETDYEAQANSDVVTSLEIVPLGDDESLVTFVTKEPSLGYLLNKSKKTPYLPTYSLDMRKEHTIVIPTRVLEQEDISIVAGTSEVRISDYNE